jgi:hypothetical protein
MGDTVPNKAGRANLFTMFGEPDVQIDHTDEVIASAAKPTPCH